MHKKVAIISNATSPILGFRKHLIQFLLKKNCTVYCLSPNYTDKSKQKVETLGAFPIDYPLSRSGLNPIGDIKTFSELKKRLKELAPDAVLTSFVKPNIYGTMAAATTNIPSKLAMVEGLGYAFTEDGQKESFKKKLVRMVEVALYRYALHKADHVIFLNHDDPKELIDRQGVKINKHTIINGIGLDLTEYPYVPAAPTQPLKFLFIGRLLIHKGIKEFIQAAEIVKQHYPDTTFTIVGGLDAKNPACISSDEMRRYTENETIQYDGIVSNVNEYLARSSVFVLPSYREGLPRSTQEAMATGRAVITTDVPGCRETVEEGVNGFIVPVRDAKALADAMIKFIRQPNLVRTMGDASYEIAKDKFDGDKINEQITDLLFTKQ